MLLSVLLREVVEASLVEERVALLGVGASLLEVAVVVQGCQVALVVAADQPSWMSCFLRPCFQVILVSRKASQIQQQQSRLPSQTLLPQV